MKFKRTVDYNEFEVLSKTGNVFKFKNDDRSDCYAYSGFYSNMRENEMLQLYYEMYHMYLKEIPITYKGAT